MKNLKHLLFFLLLSSFTWSSSAQSNQVRVEQSQFGFKLMVDGKPMMINGINWDYFPVGTNYSFSLWNQTDEYIKYALDNEMALLKHMGINTIRVYTGIQQKWIKYIYETYGIYTMLNHSFGRYGLTLDGAWYPNTEYSDPRVKELLLKEVKQLANDYKDTPGLLLILLGNENNYGLFWGGAETEDIPIKDRKSTKRARSMYKLFNEASKLYNEIDNNHPVAICNGDLLFLEIIAEECKDVDILGINVYRGPSFSDLFDRVKKEYGKPVLLSEFGSDAFNARANKEDQKAQAKIDVENWKEIYANAAGMGKAGNSLGGFTFQFSDGWWKYGQTKNLDVHDTHASWANGGYKFDYREGQNNMNEEWFGICAKGQTTADGHYTLYPRAAYYALQEAHQFNVYAPGANYAALENHFNNIDVMGSVLRARSDMSVLGSETSSMLSISRLGVELNTYNTGGSLITTPQSAPANSNKYPNELGFDHMESFFVGVQANPTSNFQANVEFNILGNVAQNPINEIFYENRGRPVQVQTANGDVTFNDINRFQVYRASYTWEHDLFSMVGFYRTGHYHWGYEGDFFGLYPEANYGPVMDTYNGDAPFGFEVTGKEKFDGLKLAFGPQLWWGANPAVLLKYSKKIGKMEFTGIFHEDIEQRGLTESSFAIPQPKTRRLALAFERKFGNLGINLGGLWAGQPLIGREFQVVRGEEGNYTVYETEIQSKDNFGGKFKLTYQKGRFNYYLQSAAMGLVAQGGADQTITFTGWKLKESGSGNQYNVLSGFTYLIGNFQIAPNFLYQKPFEGPIPDGVDAPGRPRNILDDPFVVRSNREQTSGEILITFDPTPGTWMYNWDSDRSEDAELAFSLGFIYRHLPTTQDAAIGILPDGRTTFAFPGAAPAEDLWEVYSRVISKPTKNFGYIANLYGGKAQANGSDERTIYRYGVDLRMIYKKIRFQSFFRLNDWGPYDYHRDFNLTYPMQVMGDVSLSLGRPDWFNMPGTRFGIQATYRTLDKYSPRYQPTTMVDPSGNVVPDPNAVGFDNGNEWEIRTYLVINIGK
jgi:hypothetical protein